MTGFRGGEGSEVTFSFLITFLSIFLEPFQKHRKQIIYTPWEKTSPEKISNQKNEKLSLAGPSSIMRGRPVPSADRFSRLIWRLNCQLGRWGRVNSSILFAVNPHNWPDTLLFYFTAELSKLPVSLVEAEAILGFSQRFSMKEKPQPLSLLSFFPYRESAVQFISTYLDLKRKHFSLQWITLGSCKVRPTSKRIPPLPF